MTYSLYIYFKNVFIIDDSLGKEGRRDVGLGFYFFILMARASLFKKEYCGLKYGPVVTIFPQK